MTRLYGTRQLATALGVSPGTVARWYRQGLLPAARVGQRGWLRFDLDAVRQAVGAKARRPAEAR